MRFCKVPGCQTKTTGYSPYCTTHKSRARRHGDPAQRSVTVARLKPYVCLVRAWAKRQPNQEALWASFERVLGALVEQSAGRLTDFRSGARAVRYSIRAHEEMVKLAADIEPRNIIASVAAMAIMVEREPNAFKTDRAIWTQTARRVRALSDRHIGTYWDEARKRVTRVYRDGPPKTAECLGKMLMTHLGSIGVHIHQHEKTEKLPLTSATEDMRQVLAATEQRGADGAHTQTER